MTESHDAHEENDGVPGDELLGVLAALANPHRLRIIASLVTRRNYVSQLARELGMSRPLLHMHLQRLERAGLIVGASEIAEDGKAMKYYEVAPFAIRLTPASIAGAVATLADLERRTTDGPDAGRA
ncbi:MAG: winged helix-turn-helix domain-containing protein [Thermomicrobiales bacterium]